MKDVHVAEPHGGLYQGNLLNEAVRREITDLNHLFLERALHPDDREDAWFRLPPCAVTRLRGAPEAVRERIARCPLALFELRLPGPSASVADAGDEAAFAPRLEARRAFGVVVLGVVRRLTEGVPLAPRIAFGLDAPLEARLAAMTLSESYRLAAWSGLIRPRWPGHDRYWALLAEAVWHDDGVHWAYAAGLCLPAQCERQPATAAVAPRRPARPGHRRPPPASRDVPC
jgi:hypothetical protein